MRDQYQNCFLVFISIVQKDTLSLLNPDFLIQVDTNLIQ